MRAGEYRDVFGRRGPARRILSTRVRQSEHGAPRAPVIKENYGQQIITGDEHGQSWVKRGALHHPVPSRPRHVSLYGREILSPLAASRSILSIPQSTEEARTLDTIRGIAALTVLAFPAASSLAHPC